MKPAVTLLAAASCLALVTAFAFAAGPAPTPDTAPTTTAPPARPGPGAAGEASPGPDLWTHPCQGSAGARRDQAALPGGLQRQGGRARFPEGAQHALRHGDRSGLPLRDRDQDPGRQGRAGAAE